MLLLLGLNYCSMANCTEQHSSYLANVVVYQCGNY